MSLKFHEPSRRIIVANRDSRRSQARISCITPPCSSQGGPGPTWVLDSDNATVPVHFVLPGSNDDTSVYACQPAPASSRLTCIFGTSQGIAKMQNDKLTWLTPPAPSRPAFNHQHWKQGGGATGQAPNKSVPPWTRDVLSVDFLAQNPADVVLAGTRSSRVCLLDLRTPPDEWRPKSNTFRHHSSVAHVRSVGPYSVLAAGPQNAMSLYDVRFLQQQKRQPRQPGGGGAGESKHGCWGNAAKSIVEFPAYRNKAHIKTGLDVLAEPGYGSNGIVAAAHDDGTVGLYSLQDGTRIVSPVVDGIKALREVMSLMWQTLPGDRHPSLFVGEGSEIKKYSFWA